mgnify:CR=1 FL=1
MTFPSTVFVPGTTITHEWLNAVNDVCVIGPDSDNVSSYRFLNLFLIEDFLKLNL